MGSGAMGKAPKERKIKNKPKERWLLTRKTWRYMADAGRRLIPEGALNRAEDVPKIEAYFQEVCHKESRFLLWRKGSYPGALAFRSHRRRKDRRTIGGSCRAKASSADEADDVRTTDVTARPLCARVDVNKLKYDFLNRREPVDHPLLETTEEETGVEDQLVEMLERYLKLGPVQEPRVDGAELINKLRQHYETVTRRNVPGTSSNILQNKTDNVLSATLGRYLRERATSDLLMDRKLLEKLCVELRKNKNRLVLSSQWRTSMLHDETYDTDDEMDGVMGGRIRPTTLPVISIQDEVRRTHGTQTLPVLEKELIRIEQELEANARKEREENASGMMSPGGSASRRRSSVENDDVSQSVSDTIKRYLRMARKKSSDADKADRFKRINYDKNLRNIKAKNVVDSPSEDDGNSKGCQTEDAWTSAYRISAVAATGASSEYSSSCDERASVAASPPTLSPPPTPSASFLSTGQSFLSHLLHGKQHTNPAQSHQSGSAAVPAAMQKSKSSSSVVHQGSRLVAKKIFRSRSKSQSRLQALQSPWTPQGGCVWSHVTGRQVILTDRSLLQLTDVERRLLHKVALAKLQTYNLGVTVRPPTGK